MGIQYVHVDRTGSPLTVPPSDRLDLPGNWVDVVFDHDISDSFDHHPTGSASFINGRTAGAYAWGTLDLRLEGFAPDIEIQIRTFEVDTGGGVVETHEPMQVHNDPPHPADWPDIPLTCHVRFPIAAYVNAGHLLRAQVAQWPADQTAPAGRIVKADALMFATPA